MYICICNAITESQIQSAAENGVCTLSELRMRLGLGAGCGKCMKHAHHLLKRKRQQKTIQQSSDPSHFLRLAS